jgi:hypothetical protein
MPNSVVAEPLPDRLSHGEKERHVGLSNPSQLFLFNRIDKNIQIG